MVGRMPIGGILTMSVTIKFKRGNEANIPTLAAGEPAFCTDSYKMFIGDGSSNREVITPNSTALDSRYYTETELGNHTDNANAGAKKIGAYDEFSNSSSSNVQDVLKDFDSAITSAASGGEVNTASNQGAGGVGIFYQKSGVDLQFKNINTDGSHITITDDSANHEIDIKTDATNNNTAGTIVARDASGNFSAGTITADLTGNASTATTLETARTFQISGDGTASSVSFNGSANVDLNLTVDKVDGKDVDDTETSTSYLWTAGKIISYVEGNLNGVSWQNPVIDKDLITPPGSPSTGDRYIVGANTVSISSTTASTKTIETASDISASLAASDVIKIKGATTNGVNGQYTVSSVSGTSVVVNESIVDSTSEGTFYHADGDWSDIGPDEIVEWDGSDWNNVTDGSGAPGEGWACWVEDEDKNYTFNGNNWVKFGSTQNHDGLSGLQGGTTNEYYHLTNAQHTGLTGGNDTSLHKHDDRYYTETELQTSGSAQVHWDNISNKIDATTSAKGIASFNSNHFSASSGAISLVTDGIDATLIDWGTGANQISTTDMPEGTNLYYTDARAQAAISVADTHSLDLSYSSGQISGNVLVDDDTIKIDTVNDYIYVNSVDGGSF